MTNPVPPTPYGSARDLPSVLALEDQLRGFRSLMAMGLASAETRDRMNATEAQIHRLTTMVDDFYELLGPRNWVFSGDLSLGEVEKIIDTADPVVAEQRLIEYYKADRRISFQLILLNKLPGMKPRITLLERALADYQAGRYYSTVLVLLAVMDGFVNDTDKHSGRKNLNKRNAADMVPWDSVAGHHLGLSHAHATFNTGVYKTVTRETTELLRNGIMHGMIVNFDNEIVATKAWNRLFAVVDWAKGREKQANPPEPTPPSTWNDIRQRLRERDDRKRRLNAWKPHEHAVSLDSNDHTDIDRACLDFLQRWEKKQWGLVGNHLYVAGKRVPTVGQRAELAKKTYSRFLLSSSSLDRIQHKTPSLVEAHATLTVNGSPHTALLKWLYSDGKGSTLFDWQDDGTWQLSLYRPALFLTDIT